MRLKKLKIVGFKSFADITKLNFDSGITAIVGPNGCGKSNIVDAFRWVTGEQSPKSLRGGKMPDVIFAGTTHRKPLNFAEVTITLSEIEGQLPVDYNEIEITRRLHRSGESEYLINRHLVRLKDVQALLMDSGIGRNAYSIFEQGEIDKVINLTPLERRYIFEEAAGILRFLQRKRGALKKLEQSDLNISRVKDIHQEVEKQIIVLQGQAEKARQHKEDKNNLELFEKTLLILKYDGLHARNQEVMRKGNDRDNSIAEIQADILSLQAQSIEAKQSLTESEAVLNKRKESYFKVNSTKEIKVKEKLSYEERVKELTAKEKRWQHELNTISQQRQQRGLEKKSIEGLQRDVAERQLNLESEIELQSNQLKSHEEDLIKRRDQQQVKQREWLKLLNHENQSEKEVGQLNVRLEGSLERQLRMLKRQDHIKLTTHELVLKVEEQQKQQSEASRSVEGQKSIFSSMESELNSFREEIKKIQSLMDGIQQEISEGKARYKALQRLRDDMEGFSSGCKKLLQESINPKSPIYNKLKCLYEYFPMQKGVETAFASIMKPYAHSLVAETSADFELAVEFALKNEIKDVSFFCLEFIVNQVKSKKTSVKSDVTFDVNIIPLANEFTESDISRHFLEGVYLDKSGESLVNVIKIVPGFEVCTKEGVLIDRRSVVFYPAQGENNIFLREAELKSLQKKLADGQSEKEKLENVLKAIQEKYSLLQSERLELDKTIRRGEMRLVELNFSVKKSIADLEKMREEEKQIANELTGIVNAITELKNNLEALKSKNSSDKSDVLAAKKEIEIVNRQEEESAAMVKQQTSVLREKENFLYQLKEEARKYVHSLHVIEVKDLEGFQQSKRMQEEIEAGIVLQSEIKLKGSEIDEILGKVEKALTDVIEECSELEQQLGSCKRLVDHLSAKLNEKLAVSRKFENERHQLGIQSAQLESQCQLIENELQERHQLTIENARAVCAINNRTVEYVEKQIRLFRQQIEAAGNVNMTSIEECEKHQARYEFLNQQIDDLSVSKQELVQIITELDGESRKIFKGTFDQISINFKKNFELLFGGGEAELQFTETGDILEAGIEIIAKPPGKQMRSISLLSGGEKCLTAMALLFAIFEVKPSPFCILDEIDAPLDDSNVERFTNIVKLFVHQCQFIIVTHNKRTMGIADVIFGVSMEERGISKLLTMDLSHSQPVPALTS